MTYILSYRRLSACQYTMDWIILWRQHYVSWWHSVVLTKNNNFSTPWVVRRRHASVCSSISETCLPYDQIILSWFRSVVWNGIPVRRQRSLNNTIERLECPVLSRVAVHSRRLVWGAIQNCCAVFQSCSIPGFYFEIVIHFGKPWKYWEWATNICSHLRLNSCVYFRDLTLLLAQPEHSGYMANKI